MSSSSNGGFICSTMRIAEPVRLPVAASPCSSSSTRCTSVATSQSASRAIVCPTARVRLTARSKSMTSLSTMPVRVETAPTSALGEGHLEAVLGEAERPPEPAQLVDGDAGLLGHLERGEDAAPRRGWRARARRVALRALRCHRPRGAGGRPGGAARRRPSAAPARPAGCRASSTRPCSLASETTSVPQPKIRSMTPISKSTPLIRLSGMVRPSLAIRPERLMKRRLVKVYARGGPGDERPHHPPEDHQRGHDPHDDVRRCRRRRPRPAG